MASAEFEKRKQEEYEMQLFGFHSRAVFARLQAIVYENIHQKCKKLCKALEDKYKPDSENFKKLDAKEKELVQLYCKSAMPYLEKMENYVNKYVSVPHNVLLEEDTCQKKQYSDAEFQNMQRKLAELQHRAKQGIILKAALQEELKVIEQLNGFEENVGELFKVIDHSVVFFTLYNGSKHNAITKLMENCKQFNCELSNEISVTQKRKYNTVQNLKCTDFDLNKLEL